jgi:metallo-beta-lactamase family protein
MVVIVGFQAQHTLGRRLVERRAQVRIFGVYRDLRAEVVVLNGFSAHADQKDLTAFARQVALRGALEAIVLVHGEPSAQSALRARLGDIAVPVHVPAPRERLTF